MESSPNSLSSWPLNTIIGGDLVPSATIHSIAVTWILSYPLFLILTSFEIILAIVLVLGVFMNNGVSFMFTIWLRSKLLSHRRFLFDLVNFLIFLAKILVVSD